MPCSSGRKTAGFTLIELLVVIAILALLVGIAVPVLAKSTSRAALGAATAEIRNALAGIRTQAMTEGRTILFRGDPSAGYWIDGKHHKAAVAAADRVRIAVAGAGRVSFFPWGGSSGGRVWVENSYGRREIDVDAVTSRAVVRP